MRSKQKYKVFINDKPVVFTDVPHSCRQECHIASINDDIPKAASDLLPGEGICVVVVNPEKAWEKFVSHYKVIVAAGGVVKQSDNPGNILMIFRMGKWDLPKGKLDPGETSEVAAMREVEEECGISGMTITKRLSDTWHMYRVKGEWLLKQSIWYEMHYAGSAKPIPQTKEHITEARWISTDDLAYKLPDAYASIRELLQQYLP